MFPLITKKVCLEYNLRGDGDPRWGFIPQVMVMGKKCPPQPFRGSPWRIFFSLGDGDGEVQPDREFLVAIPNCTTLALITCWNSRERSDILRMSSADRAYSYIKHVLYCIPHCSYSEV